MKLITLRIDFGTPLYDETIRLRNKILRAPLGLEFTEEELAREWEDFHLGILTPEMELLGCLVMQPLSEHSIKMRQVAIDEGHQSKGLGKQLVKFSEEFSKAHGFSKIELNARETAVPFYQKLQYEILGDQFIEVSIPHFKMFKKL